MDFNPRYFGDQSPEIVTHRPNTGLPNRVILDANIILYFFLFLDGPIHVLGRLISEGYTLYITKTVLEECRKTLEKSRDNYEEIFDVLKKSIEGSQIMMLDSGNDFPGVNPCDRHLARAAIDIDGYVLTDDTPLLLELDRSHVHGRSLREQLWEFSDEKTQQWLLSLGTCFAADGHILIKATFNPSYLTSWRAKFTLWFHPSLGTLIYDGSISAFVYIPWDGSAPIRLPFVLERGIPFAALLNYSVG
ncbi:PIN domain-containing protein [Sphingobium nicotianae]|uniref:PIN domain-containing protein n=1 Tax=Sphingobium nicotianae TaxID=2782607 RepID=A0A9X1IQG9_9SPHN|nr:PIN domain-containing protein [Sphingobium nicotianae]MBT2186702.1 hypothetical protein [Sphingobium nicotianae]